MGDRGNIAVVQPDGGRVYLYTHWDGSQIGAILQDALKKRWRWDDPAYLTRIIYDTLVGPAFGQETGYGITTTPPDNEHPILVVEDGLVTAVEVHGVIVTGPWTYEEFIALEDVDEKILHR